jgi:SAM-dependent methyltransferase
MYFAEREAARRYDQYRPKVRGEALRWLREHQTVAIYERAVDVACGTGDSTLPLLSVARTVEGIDLSECMLSHARAKGLMVRKASYADLQGSAFDLISVCMAFHWFDPVAAVSAFKNASADRATWLVYNFALLGHRSDERVNNWLRAGYLSSFPSPQRGGSEFVVPSGDENLRLVGAAKGALPVRLTRQSLIGYLTTQSNVEAAVQAGHSYEAIEAKLDRDMPEFEGEGEFRYGYSYAVVEFRRA